MSLWRKTDGAGRSGVIDILTYTGDGTGARNIAVALAGNTPGFVLVQPTDSVAFTRDPGETGSNSHAINVSGGSPSTTAITAVAANQFTVGATLNVAGKIYNVLVFPVANGGVPQVIDDPPPVPPTGPSSFNGWWPSSNGYSGASTVIAYPASNPRDARDWQKINVYAAGNAGFYGGSPGPGCTVNNFFIYAGNDYFPGTQQPTIRIFDGLSDRLMLTIPDVAGVKTIAIMTMLAVGSQIYLTTLDSGTTSSTWAGRVFLFDPVSLSLTQLGAQFTGGNMPYCLAWHQNRLFLGANKQDGSATNVYWFRPGIDTAWTTDYTLTTSGVGGALSMVSFNGLLYVGCNVTNIMNVARVVVRDTLGAYTTSLNATGLGTIRSSSGFCAMAIFKGDLYASYFNPDTTNVSVIYKLSATTGSWSLVYTAAGVTLRPFVGLIVVQNVLYAIGGGSGLAACLLSTTDGSTWTDKTGFLTSNVGVTAEPIIGYLGA
jgi:hypothetical protein